MTNLTTATENANIKHREKTNLVHKAEQDRTKQRKEERKKKKNNTTQ